MNFQTIKIPKGFWQKFCQKKGGLGKHSYLKYALVSNTLKVRQNALFSNNMEKLMKLTMT